MQPPLSPIDLPSTDALHQLIAALRSAPPEHLSLPLVFPPFPDTRPNLEAYQSWLEGRLASGEAYLLTPQEGCACLLQKKEWDSQHFGKPLYEAEFFAPPDFEDLHSWEKWLPGVLHCQSQLLALGGEGLTVEVDSSRAALTYALQACGFRMTASTVTLTSSLASLPDREPAPALADCTIQEVTDCTTLDLEVLRQLMRGAFQGFHSRFLDDPRYDPRLALEVYPTWVTNILTTYSDRVWVALDSEGRPLALMNLKRLDLASMLTNDEIWEIPLTVAVPSSRGKHVVSSLWKQVVDTLRHEVPQAKLLQRTAFQNLTILRSLTRLGQSITRTTHLFHWQRPPRA